MRHPAGLLLRLGEDIFIDEALLGQRAMKSQQGAVLLRAGGLQEQAPCRREEFFKAGIHIRHGLQEREQQCVAGNVLDVPQRKTLLRTGLDRRRDLRIAGQKVGHGP
jgi:hypothetical protein